MRSELIAALIENQAVFGQDLSDSAMERLADYHALIQEHNPLLHLVAPCPPAEFATRHILESLTMLKHLAKGARFADIGSGGGLPAIPCLIARDDLSAVLIESKEKKADFLRLALAGLKLVDRTEVIARQFSEVSRPDVSHVTCRALDKFIEKLPRLVKWSAGSKLLFFGGDSLGDALTANHVALSEELMPLSERRYLFVADPPERKAVLRHLGC